MSEQDLQQLPPARRPLIIQQKQSVKPVYVADEALPAKENHTWECEGGYMANPYVHQEFPKMLYRLRSAEEIQIERDNLSWENWTDKDFDLLLATGHNQKRNKQGYEAWVTRHVDKTVETAKEEAAARKEGFLNLHEHAKAK